MNVARQAVVVKLWPRGLSVRRPRLGFLGLGWIGRLRLQALLEADIAEVVAVADIDPAQQRTPPRGARACESLDALLRCQPDGIVIATPSGLHAAQALAALQQGCAVFCQKPLARSAAEAAAVVQAARAHDRLLAVDSSYRHLAGIRELRTQMQAGELGDIYAVELAFHNAYGPDKPWFRDLALAGGGCAMDLGVHLLDLAFWMTDSTRVERLGAILHHDGQRLDPPLQVPEDYACVQGVLDTGACLRMTCSWCLPVGTGASIEASFYGTRGGATLRNVAGSFYDFTLDRHAGTRSWRVASPPDAWGGRALVEWTRRLAHGASFDEEICRELDVAAVLDAIYAR